MREEPGSAARGQGSSRSLQSDAANPFGHIRSEFISAGQDDKECETVIAPLKLTFRMSNSLGSATEL